MGAAISVGCGAAVAGFRGDGAVARFHISTTVTFIGANAAEARVAGGGSVTARGVGQGGGALELAENGFFMGEEVADEAVGMAFVHSERGVCAGAKDAGGKGLGERGDVLFCCRGEFDKTGKVGGYCIEGGDVSKTELTEGVLENRNAGCRGGGGVGG